MKKFKLLILFLCLSLLIPLSSCDLSLLLQDSNKEKIIDNNTDINDITDVDDDIDKDKDIEKEPIDSKIEEYDMNLYLIDYHNNYGYKSLSNDENGTIMQDIYSNFYEKSKTILLSNLDYDISTKIIDGAETNYLSIYESDDFEDENLILYYTSVWSVFISENPIFYFLTNSYVISQKNITTTQTIAGVTTTTSKTTYSFVLMGYSEFINYDNRDIINKKIINLFNLTNEISTLESEYLKINFINNYLKDNLQYAFKNDGITPEDSYWAHNILGLLDENKGVCECYSKSFKLLCDYYGLNAISVYGKTIESNSGHAWNYINIDDIWYGMDVTWNDTTNSNKYFLCSKSIMDDDHLPFDSIYGKEYQVVLPTLSSYNY